MLESYYITIKSKNETKIHCDIKNKYFTVTRLTCIEKINLTDNDKLYLKNNEKVDINNNKTNLIIKEKSNEKILYNATKEK